MGQLMGDLTFITATDNVTKSFYYKIYDADSGLFVKIWSDEVISFPKFKNLINAGSGELFVGLARKFDDFGEDVDVKLNNRVEVYVIDRDNPDGLLYFQGFISGYKPIVSFGEESVGVTIWGFNNELARMILRDAAGNTTITYNSYDPSAIMKDVIDKYRAIGGTLNYDDDSIDLTNTTVSYTFNTNTIQECFDKIIELCPIGWYFRIEASGTIHLHPKKDTADHTFNLGLEIQGLGTFRRIEDIVNRVLFIGGGNPALFRKYENTGSQNSYGLHEVKKVDQRVTTIATAETISNRIIDSKKDPEIRSIFRITDNNGPDTDEGYDIESIKVGQTLQVKNLKESVKTTTLWDIGVWDVDVWDQTITASAADILQIVSVEYKPDFVIVEASSRLPQISKRIEDVNRNLEVTQAINNPSSPS